MDDFYHGPPRFNKGIVRNAYRKLPEGDQGLLQRQVAKLEEIPHIGDYMALSILAHLGAWLEEHAD